MRQQAIKAVPEGQTVKSVAAAFGVNQRSVFCWLADFANGGQNALLAKPVPGRPTKLSAEQIAWIANSVRDYNPQQFKFDFGMWTLSLIRYLYLIERQFNNELSLSSVDRLMKILGFSAQKPLYQAWQQDPVLVRTLETHTYPAIRAEAKRVGATIYFGNKSGIRSDYRTGTTLAPQGQTPVDEATGRRFLLDMISATSTQGELRLMLHEGSVDAAVFLEFIKRLIANTKKQVFLILDGHSIHKAKIVRNCVDGQAEKLKLLYLPLYSLHLNPDEAALAHVKRMVCGNWSKARQTLRGSLLEICAIIISHLNSSSYYYGSQSSATS